MKKMQELMADESHKFNMESYQEYIKDLYSGINNKERDFSDLYGYLHRNIGNLGKSIAKDDGDQAKFVSPISWIFSIANYLDYNLLKALINKFPGFCPYCYKSTCICYKTEKQAPREMSLEDMQHAMYFKWEEVKGSSETFDLDKAVKFITSIYPNNEIIWIASGYKQHFLKIHQELAEVHEAHSKYDRAKGKNNSPKAKKLLVPVMDEIADVLAWILSAWTIKYPNSSLDTAFKNYYINDCDVCLSAPCQCGKSDSPTEALIGTKKLIELKRNLEQLSPLFNENKEEYSNLLDAYEEISDIHRESFAWAALTRTKAILEKAQGTAILIDPEGTSSEALLSASNIIASLLNQAGSFSKKKAYDVFLSYSTLNSNQANKIYDFLISKGVKVFMSQKEIQPSANWEEVIKHALKNSRLFCILASKESLSSDWVKSEVSIAWYADKPTLPILYQCSVDDLPNTLQRYQSIDFYQHEKIVGVIEKIP